MATQVPATTDSTPVPKVQAALLAGAVTTLIVTVLKAAFDIEVPTELSAALTTLFSFAAGYIAPRSTGE